MMSPDPTDPLIDEVRAIRKHLDDRSGNDLRRLAAEARRAGEEHRRRQREAAKRKDALAATGLPDTQER